VKFEEFSNFLRTLKDTVRTLEFRVLDEKGEGAISSSQFVESLLSYSRIKEAEKVYSRLEKLLSKTSHQLPLFTETQFVEWFRVLDSVEELTQAIELFVTSGKPFTPKTFKKAAKIVSGLELDLSQVSLVFSLFDETGTGKLSYSQLTKIISARNRRGLTSFYSSPSSFSSLYFLYSCSLDCFSHEILDRSSR